MVSDASLTAVPVFGFLRERLPSSCGRQLQAAASAYACSVLMTQEAAKCLSSKSGIFAEYALPEAVEVTLDWTIGVAIRACSAIVPVQKNVLHADTWHQAQHRFLRGKLVAYIDDLLHCCVARQQQLTGGITSMQAWRTVCCSARLMTICPQAFA